MKKKTSLPFTLGFLRQDVNLAYIRRSEDCNIMFFVFWTLYAHSIYVLCPGGFWYSLNWGCRMFIYDAVHDLVSFVLFKKRGKHPWRSDTFSKVTNRARCHIYLGVSISWTPFERLVYIWLRVLFRWLFFLVQKS